MSIADISRCCAGRTAFVGNWERTEEQRKMCKALEEVAKQVGTKSIQAGQYIPRHDRLPSERR